VAQHVLAGVVPLAAEVYVLLCQGKVRSKTFRERVGCSLASRVLHADAGRIAHPACHRWCCVLRRARQHLLAGTELLAADVYIVLHHSQ
jgi:hypothetical protein